MNPQWRHNPGETPIGDASGLKASGITTRQELMIAEAENIRQAVMKYLLAPIDSALAPFDFEWFLNLHREMFGDVWDWAGVIRREELNLGIPCSQIGESLQALTGDLRFWEQHWPDLVEQAAHLHYRAVQIHPFLNGNGRWARMLANIWLHIHGSPVTAWPEQVTGSVSTVRGEYLDAVQAADRGDLEHLIELHRRFSEGNDDHSDGT